MKLIIAIIHKEHLFLKLIYHVMLFTLAQQDIYSVCVCVCDRMCSCL